MMHGLTNGLTRKLLALTCGVLTVLLVSAELSPADARRGHGGGGGSHRFSGFGHGHGGGGMRHYGGSRYYSGHGHHRRYRGGIYLGVPPAYYYGSDYRGGAGDAFTLTYMSAMGGWGVLNHALYDRREPDATIRLGYASFLSVWSLMNTGTPETGFGYWFPGEANDGGTGGGFEPAAYGMTWLGLPHHRGPWYYSSETDLGYCGALRSASKFRGGP